MPSGPAQTGTKHTEMSHKTAGKRKTTLPTSQLGQHALTGHSSHSSGLARSSGLRTKGTSRHATCDIASGHLADRLEGNGS
jgi:hypothetical protein